MRKLLKAISDELIYGGHFLAFGSVCIVYFSSILLGIRMTWDYGIIVYCVALAPCLFGRFVDLGNDKLTNPERSVYFQKKARLVPFYIGLLLLAIVGISTYFNKPIMAFLTIGLVLLSFVYDLYLKKLTKIIIGFKNIFVGALFAMLSLMLIYYYDQPITLSSMVVLFYTFMMIGIAAAFSDLKDIDSDKRDGLKTFAVYFGHTKLIIFLSILTSLVGLALIAGVYFRIIPNFSIMLIFAVIYNYMLFIWSKRPNIDKNFLVNVLCDSQLIMWLILILVGRALIK